MSTLSPVLLRSPSGAFAALAPLCVDMVFHLKDPARSCVPVAQGHPFIVVIRLMSFFMWRIGHHNYNFSGQQLALLLRVL